MQLNEIKLFNENIENYDFLEDKNNPHNRLYYKQPDPRVPIIYFLCLSLDGYSSTDKNQEEKWSNGDLIATLYGTVNREGLRTIYLTEGDTPDIGTDKEDEGGLELSTTTELIAHLGLIKQLEKMILNTWR